MLYKITVFTPTFNRAYCLHNLYESLKKQTFTDFEWLIVDDGSTDHTEELVNSWINEKPAFPINYHKCLNGGKHRAINKGLDLAKGYLYFVVDSDDYLADNALSKIIAYEESLHKIPDYKEKYAGVCGLRAYKDGKVIGTTFKGEYLDCLAFKSVNYKIRGDKAEVYYTELLKKYKIPEFDHEKFAPEELYHFRIAGDGYQLRYFNEVIYIGDYLDDGLTVKINLLLYDNFQAYTLRCKEFMRYDINRLRKAQVIGKYALMARKKGMQYNEIKGILNVNKLLIVLLQFAAKLYYKCS